MKFETLDSGEREEYDSGMRRDTQAGKPAYSLIDRAMLKRWAELMTRGAEKYGRRNWELADSDDELERFIDSAFRHFVQWLDGEPDEDHAAAVFFNIAAAEYVKKRQELNYYEGNVYRAQSQGVTIPPDEAVANSMFVWMEDQPGFHTHPEDECGWEITDNHTLPAEHDMFKLHYHNKRHGAYEGVNYPGTLNPMVEPE